MWEGECYYSLDTEHSLFHISRLISFKVSQRDEQNGKSGWLSSKGTKRYLYSLK